MDQYFCDYYSYISMDVTTATAAGLSEQISIRQASSPSKPNECLAVKINSDQSWFTFGGLQNVSPSGFTFSLTIPPLAPGVSDNNVQFQQTGELVNRTGVVTITLNH